MSKALAKIDAGSFLPISDGMANTRAVIEANLGGEELNMSHLERLVNPSGKSTSWESEDIDGTTATFSEIQGVMIHHKVVRAYWATEFSGGSNPPDCSSEDGVIGEGNPGGSCKDCPYAVFGSGPNNSQACKQIRQVYMLQPDRLLPTFINCSPVNVGAAFRYAIKLTDKKRLPYFHVITRVNLESDRSTSGFDYAKIIFSMVEALPVEEREKMTLYREMMLPYFQQMKVSETLGEDPIAEPDF